MFYHRRYYHNTHGFLFLLSLVAAFFLGRKSEQYGFSIISRGFGYHDDVDAEMDMMDAPNDSTPSYPR